MKCLTTRTINVAQRRRRLQAELDSADPFVYQKKLLDFVAVNKFRKYMLVVLSRKQQRAYIFVFVTYKTIVYKSFSLL